MWIVCACLRSLWITPSACTATAVSIWLSAFFLVEGSGTLCCVGAIRVRLVNSLRYVFWGTVDGAARALTHSTAVCFCCQFKATVGT